jgi:hypothetical protein
LVNAETRQAALRVIAQTIAGEGAYAKARALVVELERKHAAIAHLFGSGAGLRLQRRCDIGDGLPALGVEIVDADGRRSAGRVHFLLPGGASRTTTPPVPKGRPLMLPIA